MGEQMTFPETFEEFAEEHKIVDKERVYTNGSELIPIFRVKQWLEHQALLAEQSGWISVEDDFPRENGIYCVMVEHHKSRKYKQRTHARYKNGRWLDLYDNWENRCWDVTHWMPLPEAPKMKGGEAE